ncbi:MAG: hypothetical protein M3O09_15950 [Acidobacteriota bacterium]|nr:hypothetical protein [Acidobacteriota bacterium]
MKVRLLERRDIPRLIEITKTKSQQLGVDFWLPPLEESKCVFVLEEDSQVVAALVFRQVTEMILVGDQPKAVKGLMRYEPRIRAVLKRAGVDSMLAFLPKALVKAGRKSGMERIMERLKFRKLDENFTSFEGEVE